ncbi:MAG TPA: hypothetical protein VFV71_13345 [Burkholderiales bacterium]|nr:hypothetical protein [Burkholderiales bacterium]
MKRMLCGLAGLLALAACSTTELTNSWRDPKYSSGPIKSVLIFGISNQASVRRAFEDTFARELTAAGVTAVPSYTVVPADGRLSEDILKEAVKKSGVQGVLITRMVDRQSEISSMPVGSVAPAYYGRRPGYYGGYAGAWVGFYEPVSVQQYNYVVCETTLFNADSPEPAWSGTTRTLEPDNVAKATEGFARTMIPVLRKEMLI